MFRFAGAVLIRGLGIGLELLLLGIGKVHFWALVRHWAGRVMRTLLELGGETLSQILVL